MKTNRIFFISITAIMIFAAGQAFAQPYQYVSIDPANAVVSNDTYLFEAQAFYDVSDGNNELSGVEIRFHYNSNLLSVSAENLEQGGTANNTPQQDLADDDNDQSTDSYITVEYAGAANSWPGPAIQLPYKLCDLHVYPSFISNSYATVNVSFISTAGGYTGDGYSCTLTLCDVYTDFRVNGSPAPDIGDPSAAFPSVSPGEPVNFSALETPDQTTTLSWDFDYNGTAHSSYGASQDITYTYSAVGEYPVQLMVSNNSCSAEKTTKINVCDVKASFEYPGPVFTGDEIQFNNTSTGTAAGWYWEFSGYGSSSEENPSFAFTTEGEKSVTLTAYNDATPECSSTALKKVYVYACGVSGASFTHDSVSPDYKTAGETVQFTNTSAYTVDESYVTWKWDFGDDSVSELKNPSHVYSAPGTYTVTLEATDNTAGSEIPCVKTASQTVTILDPVSDTAPPVLTLNGSSVVYAVQGASYIDPGASAYDEQDGDLTSAIVTSGLPVNTNAPAGTRFTIFYSVSDSAGNQARASRTVIITAPPDRTPPIITLNGASQVEAVRGSTYSDPGAEAHDNRDGDISSRITVAGLPVDTNAPPGTRFTIRYNVTDTAGNKAEEAVRTVTIVEAPDTTPPVISLNGSSTVTAQQGTPYSDPGATATDNRDGDITSRIETEGLPVDTNAPAGTRFTILYSVSDSAGNRAETSRTVTITEPPDTTPPVITLLGDPSPEVFQGDVYTDAGAAARDDRDGDITSRIVVTGLPVDTLAPAGTRTAVRYNVSDSAGNPAEEVVRTVTIVEAPDNTPPNTPSLSAPENEFIFPPGTRSVQICANPFHDPDGDTHSRSRWFVRRADRVYGCSDYDPSFDADDVSGDLTCHTVSGLETGLKYYWKVQYWDDRSGHSVSREFAFKIGESELSEIAVVGPGAAAENARMISVWRWPDLPQIETSLRDEIGDYDITLFRIAAYDPMTGGYVEYGPDLDLIPGRAYWILARYGLEYAFDGVPVSLVQNMEVELFYNPDIPDGWNMIACPNNAAYHWPDVRVLQYGKTGDIRFGPVAIARLSDDNPYIDKRLRRWEDGAYLSDTELMIPGEGYWVKTLAENVYLRFLDEARADLPETGPQRRRTGLSAQRARRSIGNADDPPPPPGNLELREAIDSGGGGCFLHTAGF